MSRRWRRDTSSSGGIVVCWGGRVFSCSPFLRDRGLSIGDHLERARSLVPGAEFHLRDLEIERAVWDSTLSRLYDLTPQIDPLPDMSRRDPQGSWALLQGADLPRIQAMVKEMGAQLGAAPKKSWAMLAAAYSRAGCTTSIPDHMVMAFLRQAPILLLQKVGCCPEMIARLELLGLKTIGLLLHLTQRQMVAQFGPEGKDLFTLIHPRHPEPPVPNYLPQVLLARYDYEWPVFEPADLVPVLHQLLLQLVEGMEGQSARHLEIRLQGQGQDSYREAGRLLKDPTHRLDMLRRVADTLLQADLVKSTSQSVPCGTGVSRMTVVLSGLVSLPPQQMSMFSARPDLRPLATSMDHRFPGKLLRPRETPTEAFFPEEEYRFDPLVK